MLTISDLKRDFGPIRAVRGVSFTVAKGEVLGFLGPNGAGKSTTMRRITGFLPPTSGSATICSHKMQESPVAAKRCLGYLPENAPSYANMCVTDYLLFIAAVRGYRGAERRRRVDAAIAKSRLESVRNRPIETLSKGYRQRTCFAQAILHDPEVLIMDEPTDGLDPNQKFVVREMIREMAADKAIIISTHILEEVESVCSRAIVIADGRLVANGTPDELKARDPEGRLENVFRKLTIKSDDKEARDA